MPEIPPWLIPPNYAGIMESAARLSLGRRSQAAQELESAGRLNLAQQSEADQVGEAGDRLQLAYQQLASQEKQAAENTRAKLAQANAAMQLRQQQAESLDTYRQGMLANAAERLKRSADSNNPFTPTLMTVDGRKLIQLSPNRFSDVTPQPARLPAFKPNPVDVEEMKNLSKDIANMRKTMNETDDDQQKAQLGLAIRGAQQQLEAMRSRFVDPSAGTPGAAPSAAASLTAGTGTTPAPSPFKEGQLVRSKKDGKQYRIQNGMPVPVDAAAGGGATEDNESDTPD